MKTLILLNATDGISSELLLSSYSHIEITILHKLHKGYECHSKLWMRLLMNLAEPCPALLIPIRYSSASQ